MNKPNGLPREVYERLDRESLIRVLTEAESNELERAIYWLDRPGRFPSFWPEHDDAILRAGIENGFTARQIAKNLGKSETAVASRWARIKRARP